MFEIIKNTNIDFMGLKKYAFAFSGVIVLFGLYAVFQIYAGRANLGIDLAGGTSIQVRFEQPVAIDQVRKALAAGGFPEASLQAVPEENIILIKVSERGKEEKMVGEKVIGLLRKGFPANPQTVESVSEIGPAIGKKLRTDALFALIVSATAIIFYLGWRFEFKFGVAAALATFHDVIMLVSIFSLTTFMACVALLLFGGVVLKNFSLALAIGIIIGTYSSIFVASPIIAIWRGGKRIQGKR